MRKVLFKKWIKKELVQGSSFQRPKEGTGCWESDFLHEGIFHQWASSYEESDAGFGNYTVALVELQDGTIIEVLPTNMKFVEPIIL